MRGQVGRCLAAGARIAARSVQGDLDGEGPVLPTVLLAEVTVDMPVMREELFGPVTAVLAVDDDKQALAIANDSPYGLTASGLPSSPGRRPCPGWRGFSCAIGMEADRGFRYHPKMGVVDQVAVLLLLILIGYLGRRFRAVDEAAVGIFTAYILNISLPALILVSLQRPFSRELLGSAGIALALSSAMYAALFALAAVYPALLGLSPRERGVHRYAFIFSNVGFMGYPVVEAVLGREALFHLAIFNIPFTFLAFSIGAWLIAKEGPRPLALSWKTFVNPGVVATLLGFIFFVGSVPFPYPVHRTLGLVGDTMTPLSMVVIGAVLGSMEPRRVFGNPRNYVTILVRLLVVPALLGGTLYALGFRGLTLALPTLVSAMPVAANTTLLAALYEGDVHGASSMVFLSTLLCVLTIPLVALLLSGIK